MQAINLQTEYLTNPVGIDITSPRFFWNCEGGVSQSAWQIVATDDEGKVAWDSGKMAGAKMTQVPYQGRSLTSRDLISWRVRLWDENGNVGEWSEEASFEIGLLNKSDWKASWISGPVRSAGSEEYSTRTFNPT